MGKVLPALAALSAVLCAATCVLWLRSYRVHERYLWRSGPEVSGIINCDGRLIWKTMRPTDPRDAWGTRPSDVGYERIDGARGNWESDAAVLVDHRIGNTGPYEGGVPFLGSGIAPLPRFVLRYRAADVPHGLVAAAAAVPPFFYSRRLLRRLRHWRARSRPGICRACGYDLRATPDRCPECGVVPSPE